MSTRSKTTRSYGSPARAAAAARTRERILQAAKALFSRRGVDAVTIAAIAGRARVSASSVYTLFESKQGLLRALIESAMFGARYQKASAQLDAVAHPVQQLVMTATVARTIYESESSEMGLLRGASAFSPLLSSMEKRLERMRYDLQAPRVFKLYAEGKARKGLPRDKAQRLLCMYTSRDVYRQLVEEGGWSPDEYEGWLARTLVTELVERRFRPVGSD
jgi:AcrR family transcriptional regulator